MTVDGASTLTIGTLDGDIRTDIIVDGDMTIAGTATVNAYASVGEADDSLRTWRHYKAGGASVSVGGDIDIGGSAKVFNHCHGQSGVGVVWHADGDFTLGESAQFNGSEFSSYNKDRGNTTRAYGYGWRWPYGINVVASGTGSHGGAGGNRAADTVYGYAYAPFLPGSPGNGKKSDAPIQQMAAALKQQGVNVLPKTFVCNGKGGLFAGGKHPSDQELAEARKFATECEALVLGE